MRTSHEEFGDDDEERDETFAPPQRQAAPQTPVRRTEPKIGRNDACPCGSGKKFKHCHGK
jgi:uncharacterized protein YecA (UPF0149 family)